ncbi:MAG: DUF4157 domain-containing protein [Myxococcales bacterium]|nr:DUF4157 domain-containing protein [Myxococcales bacterium]
MRSFQDFHGADDGQVHGGSGIAPGKRSLTQSLPVQRSSAPGQDGATGGGGGASALGATGGGGGASALGSTGSRGGGGGEDPFATHLLGARGAPGLGGMPTDVQARMEASFGYDLSSVRVHQDGAADEMGARAFARGTDVHFGAGQLDPSSADGQHLMAHELAHVTQQALGRAPRSAQAKLASLLGGHDPLEAEADAMADRAVRGEPAWAGADQGPLRSLPTLSGGAVMPKLKVGGYNYKLAETIAKHVADAGGDREDRGAAAALGRDNKKAGRTFDGWADAIEAARRELDGEGSELDSDDEGGPDGGPPDDGGHGGGPAEWSTLRKVLTAFFIFVLLIGMPMLGVLLHGMNQYEVRPGMQNTAVTMRRELEPVMQMGTQIQQLAASSVTEALRERAEGLPIGEFLDGNPMLELAAPDLRRLRDMGPLLDQIAPQLDALAPMLQQVQPLIQEVGLHTLDTPASTGFHHMHIMLEPPPTTSDVPGDGLASDQEQSPLHPPDLGFFHDGVHPDRSDMMPTYGPALHAYDRDLMERAALAVAADYGHYKGITHNCQDYVDAVVTAYKELGGREVVPTHRSAAMLAVTDYLIAYGSSLLDSAIAKAVDEELAALPQAADGGSACARAVANKLGLAPGTFAGSVDALLDQPFEVPDRGTVTVRKLLCEPFDPHKVDVGLGLASVAMDVPFEMPEEGHASVRDALCTPKGGSNALEGLVFELARVKGEAQIVAELSGMLPASMMEDPLVRNKLVGDLVGRLGRDLYRRLNLKGLC